jgi:hypothetical protein
MDIERDIPDNVGSLLSLVQVEELPDLGSSVESVLFGSERGGGCIPKDD